MEFEEFTYRLRTRLASPLPGKDAQIRMAPTPVSPRRFEEDPTNPAKPSGVLILLYPFNGEIHLPLMKRPTYQGAHSGQISFPGGKFEERDTNLVDTALRETEEEIGVDRNEIEVVGQLSELFIIASNFKVTPSIGVIGYKPDFIPDPHEVAGVLTVSFSDLNDLKKRGVEKMTFRNNIVINSPYYNVRGNIVWGATAMMLSELLEVINPILE